MLCRLLISLLFAVTGPKPHSTQQPGEAEAHTGHEVGPQWSRVLGQTHAVHPHSWLFAPAPVCRVPALQPCCAGTPASAALRAHLLLLGFVKPHLKPQKLGLT